MSAAGFVVIATLTAVAQILNTTPSALVDTYVAAIPWLDLSALMAGFLVVGVRGPRTVALIEVLGGIAVSGNAMASGDLGLVWRECLMIPAHTLANGLAIAAGAGLAVTQSTTDGQTLIEASWTVTDETYSGGMVKPA